MQARPDLEAESADRLANRSRALNRPGCSWLPVESGDHSVAGGIYFFSLPRAQVSAERCVIVTQHLVPAPIAEQRSFLRRTDDINKQNSGKNATGLDARLHGTAPNA
jgi:hypothetical protein